MKQDKSSIIEVSFDGHICDVPEHILLKYKVKSLEDNAVKIKEIRIKKGISQCKLAKMVKMSPTRLCGIETGYIKLTGKMSKRIEKALGIKL